MAAQANYHQIAEKMTHDPDWADWASGKEKDRLNAVKLKLDDFKKRSDFWQDLFQLEVAAVRKYYDDDRSMAELGALHTANEVVDALVAANKRVIGMAQAAKA